MWEKVKAFWGSIKGNSAVIGAVVALAIIWLHPAWFWGALVAGVVLYVAGAIGLWSFIGGFLKPKA